MNRLDGFTATREVSLLLSVTNTPPAPAGFDSVTGSTADACGATVTPDARVMSAALTSGANTQIKAKTKAEKYRITDLVPTHRIFYGCVDATRCNARDKGSVTPNRAQLPEGRSQRGESWRGSFVGLDGGEHGIARIGEGHEGSHEDEEEVTPLDGLWEAGGLCVRCFGFGFFLRLLLAEVHVSRRRRIRAVIGRDFDHFCGLFVGILGFVWKFSVIPADAELVEVFDGAFVAAAHAGL